MNESDFEKLTYLRAELAENGETSAAELVAKAVSAIIELEAAIALADSRLRSSSENWREQCFFDAHDILKGALEGGGE